MPTLKPVLRGYKTNNKCRIYIRIIQKRKPGYLPTDYYIEPKYFKDGKAIGQYPLQGKLNKALYSLLLEYESSILDMPDIKSMDIGTLLSRLKGNDTDFFKYTEKQIQVLKDQGRIDYAQSFDAMLKHLKRHKDKLNMGQINLDFVNGFVTYLLINVRSVNSVRLYYERFKSILYIAKDNNLARQDLRFLRKIKIKKDTPEQKGLSVDEVKRIMIGPYPVAQERAVDLWKLSLFLSGANLKDLLYLKPDNVSDLRIHYGRSKTGYPFSVKIIPEALHIIEKYKGNKYLLSFLDKDDSYKHYKAFRTNLNKQLKYVMKISFYSARHSYSSIAFNDCKFSLDWIDFALGHKKPEHKITQAYIKKSVAIIDEIQEAVINKIKIFASS